MTARSAAARRGFRALEISLWTAGTLALSWCAASVVAAHRYQDEQAKALGRWLVAEGRGPDAPARPRTRPGAVSSEAAPLDPGFVAQLEIPRLKLSAIVREGGGPRTLRIAVGHLPGTALPGETGNVCLAAHRDGFFRGLGTLLPGDFVTLATRDGAYAYRVDGARVVSPDDVAILAATPEPTLTLVTCYPFAWIGPAPKRYVVTAHLEGRLGRAMPGKEAPSCCSDSRDFRRTWSPYRRAAGLPGTTTRSC